MLVCVVACSDASTSTSAPHVTIHGTVATGAHTRTPLARAYVGVMGPQGPNAGHWIRYVGSSSGFASEVTTGADGSFTYEVETAVLTDASSGFPFFLAASDDAQTLTMLAEIPHDLVKDGAELAIDINPTTTAASELICPGGASPPPANSWCYSAPASASTNTTALDGIIDHALTSLALEPGSPPAWPTFVNGLLSDPPTFSAITQNLATRGITLPASPTATTISSQIEALPLVHPPAASSSTSGGSCMLVWNCGTSTQCAGAYGAATGNRAEPDAKTCASVCASSGACSCQGC